ncbi:MAG: hypothetical protein ACTTIC_06010 [Helicobacteraceae bacterium]
MTNKEDISTLNIIAYNIGSIYRKIEHDGDGKYDDHFKKSVFKLFDHINLESVRIHDLDNNKRMQKELHKKVKQIEIELRKAKESLLYKAKKSLDGFKKYYVTILSVFSAIVLTFVGVFNFSISVFSGLNSASLKTIILTSSVVGFVFGNVLFALYVVVMNVIEIQLRRRHIVLFVLYNFVLVALFVVFSIINV